MAESPLLPHIVRAITRLGEDAPASLDDVTEIADLADDFHVAALKQVLTDHDWDFASTYVNAEAADDDDTPLIRWSNKYKLPTNLVELREVYQGSVPLKKGIGFEVGGAAPAKDGQFVMTDGGAIAFRYTRYEDNPNNWPAGFSAVYEAKLREVLAFPVTNDVTIEEKAEAKYLRTLGRAVGQNEAAGGAKQTQYDGISSVLDDL